MNETLSEGMVLDFDGWLGKQPADVRYGIDAHLKASGGTAAAEKLRLASMTAVSEETGLDLGIVNERWDTIRGGYAEQQGGEWLAVKDDEVGFHGQFIKKATKQRDRRYLIQGRDGTDEESKAMNERSLQRWAVRAALAGEPAVKAFADWKASAKPDDQEDFFPVWKNQFDAVAEKVAPHRAALSEAFTLMRRGMGVEEGGSSVFGTVIDAASPLSGMSEADFRAIGVPALRAMAELAAGGDKGRFQQTMEAFRRPVDNAGGALFDALDWFGQNLSAAGAGRESLEQGDAQRTKRTLLRAVADDAIDPIKVLATSSAGKVAEQMLYDTSGSLGYMAVAAVPYAGIPASLAGYQDSNKAQLLLRNPDMAVNDATAIAAAAAPIQTALDRLSLKMISGKMPVLSSLIQKAGAPGGNAAMRFALYGAGSISTEYLAEKLQDAAPLAMQDALAAIKADVPDADWSDFEVMDARTFFAVLPLSLIGAGVNAVRDSATARSLLQDTDALKAFGLSEGQIAGIQSAPDPMAALQAQWKERKPPADAPAQWEAYSAKLTASTGALAESMQAADVTFERGTREDGSAVYRVARGETITEHDSAGNALAAMQEHMGQQDREANGPLLEMLAELDANPLSPVREGSVTLGDAKTVAEYQSSRADILLDETADVPTKAKAERESAAMTRRQQVFEKQFPDKPIDWRAVNVGGQSELEVKEGVARAVIRVSNGESAYTPLEEKTEAEAEAWVRSGATTWTNLETMIREVEAATGDKYLNGHTAGADAAQDQLAVKEAYSELSQVHATGKGRAGKAAASGIAEVARMDRKGARMNLRQAMAQGRVAAELVARLKAQAEWLKAVVTKAVRLNRARREAGGAFAIDEFLNKSVGIEQESRHAAGVMEEAARIYTPPTAEQEADGIAFRLTPVETLDKLAAQMAKQTRDPEARRKVYEQMMRAFSTLRRNWTETRQAWNGESRPKVEKRSPKELDKEQAFREAVAVADAESVVMESLTPEAQAALGMTAEDTSAYQGPLAQRFTGGRFGTKGRIQSRADAIRNADAGDFTLGGEHNGAEGLPSMFFGGAITPDLAAQEAYEAGEIADASPDALWDALRKELKTQAGNKEAMTGALSALKDAQKQARQTAKAEAAAWRTEQDEMQAKDWDAQAVMLRHLRTLDAILSALPPEVRAKVGGWTAIASLKTQGAMQKELEHRLKVADEHLEAALKKDALADIAKLLDKARPDREGGKKSKGKLGAAVHRFFDEVERVTTLTPEQVEAERVALDVALVADGVTEAEQADIFEKQQALDMFGALGKPKAHDAAHLTRALDQLEQVYVEGRNRWRMLEEARLAEVAELARMTTETLGGPSYAGSQKQKANAGKIKSKLSKTALDLKSFGEVMTALLGDGHPLAKRWTRAAREAFAQKNDSVRALRVRWNAALETATGKRGVEARRILWEMGNAKNQTITANLAGPASTETQAIPISLIEQWADGSADPAETGVSKVEAAELIDARLALEEGDTKQNLPLKRETRGTPEAAQMNEAEGVFLTMLAAQEQYTAGLDKAGFDAAAVEQIEEQLSPAAKSLRAFLAKEYQEGYAPLAKVFERMFGVGLPQIKNYAPAAFYNMGSEQAMDPTGSGTIEGGFRAGFLKNRKEHQAAPKLENAFATFFGHANQTAHWKAMAETVREMTGVFNKPEVKRAIESAHGKEMLTAVNQWMKALEGNGLQQQAGVMDGAVRWLTSQQAYIALAWKVGTLFKQSSALMGAAYKMPTAAYLKGFTKLTTGQLEVKAMFDSPVIQRRLETGFAPEVRAAINDIWSSKPTRRQAMLEQGMELIGLVDAIFTTGSAAIAYDYHLAEAKRAGMGETEAAAAAMQETMDIVGATAQPSDVVDRSLFELRQGAFGKLVFLFASEARQKSSLWATAWGNTLTGKGTKADARVLILAHLVLGPMMQAIGSAVRDARNDDDDEWFDSTNWEPLDFLKAVVAGPLGGLPLIGNAVSGFTDSGVLGRFAMAGKSVMQLFDGAPEHEDETAEWYFKRTVRVMQGLDAFTGTLGSVAGQVFDFTDNLHDDETEQAGQAKRARARARKDAKEAKKED